MGGPLGTASVNDAVGLFVNREVAALHNEMLAAANCDWLTPTPTPISAREKDQVRAGAVLAALMGAQPRWAIVDPRAALFTGLWRALVPDAKWVFVIRPPAETAWVLMRRGLGADKALSPTRRLACGLELWKRYAARIVEFCQRASERSSLLFAPDDFGLTGDDQLATLTAGCLRPDLAMAYHPLLLRSSSPTWVKLQARVHPGVGEALQALRDIRDGQHRQRSISRSRPRVVVSTKRTVCLASRRRMAISETFIRDHLRHLPASRWLVGGAGELKRDKDDLPVGSVLERALAAGLTEFGHVGQRIDARGIARYLQREHVDVVLAEFGPVAVDYMDACKAAGVPLVAHFHGYDAYKRVILTQYGPAYRRLFSLAGALVVVSRDMARQLESLGAPAERIVWSPCGVDTVAFAGADPGRSGPTFLSVGRFVEKKAPQNVLLAFHHLANSRPDARLVMVGDGVMLDPCRLLCHSLGLADRVTFTGAVSPSDVAARMRSARAFVQHSIRDSEGNAEGTPVSVLEAGASGLPVVGTRHMGIADVVVHGETGYLVDEGDVHAMGEHMVALYDDPALAGAMGRRARAHINADFSMERATARLWGALELAIAGARAR
jgi:glycosyltransferase involved in cell wall biosynthesis